MKQIILKCKIEIDNKMDMEELNQKSTGGGGFYAYPVQAENRGKGYKGNKNFKRGYYNQNRGNRGGYGDNQNQQPINMDSRGNMRWDYQGNPIDLTKENMDSASAWYTSGLELNDRG